MYATHTLIVEEIIGDFEKAVWGALYLCLPVVSVRGCWFHWAQAVYRSGKEVWPSQCIHAPTNHQSLCAWAQGTAEPARVTH